MDMARNTKLGSVQEGDIRRILATESAGSSKATSSLTSGSTINKAEMTTPDGKRWRCINRSFLYTTCGARGSYSPYAMIDRGANGGISSPRDSRCIRYVANHTVNVRGLDNHEMTDVRIAHVAESFPGDRKAFR